MEDQRRAEQVRRIIRSIIRRINRYLVVKTAVSAVTGLAVYVIMLAFGLEFAVAMAVLTFALNYFPFPWIDHRHGHRCIDGLSTGSRAWLYFANFWDSHGSAVHARVSDRPDAYGQDPTCFRIRYRYVHGVLEFGLGCPRRLSRCSYSGGCDDNMYTYPFCTATGDSDLSRWVARL